jgi:hypothetical protein
MMAVMANVEPMADKDEEKFEVNVTVESNTSTIIAVVVLIGLLGLVAFVMVAPEGGGFLGGDGGDGSAMCADGLDNDNGGEADRDDPDCYNNPELWEGYDPNRSERNADNDPPGGRP